MRKKKKIFTQKLILSLFIIVNTFSCNNNSVVPISFDCNKLKEGLININSEVVEIEITKLMVDLKPKVTTDDRWGHSKNFATLINRLNNDCNNITAELSCYCCMYSYPPQSAILLITDSLGVNVKRTIHIWTPENDILSFARILEY